MISHSGSHSKTLVFVVGSVCLLLFLLSLIFSGVSALCSVAHGRKDWLPFLAESVFSSHYLTLLRQLLSANFLGLLNFACVNSK